MPKKIVNWVINSFAENKKSHRLIHVGIISFFILPVVLIGFVSYVRMHDHLTELTLARRESVAYLSATLLKEKFDRIIDVGISFSTRVQFRKLIEAGKWEEAIKILESAPTDFPYIDTVAIFDFKGTIMAATPLTPPIREVIGQNFAHRDYYKGVSKDWQPYVSGVFKRAVEPKYNVVSVAIPIKSGSFRGSDQKILGILLLTIKVDTILDWAREIDISAEGFAYFVDQSGHVAGHPNFSSQDEVVDFSEVPSVKKVLSGKSGVERLYNPIEKEDQLGAYQPVPIYGWGVIVQEPLKFAFARRNSQLGFDLIIYGAILLFNFLIASIFLQILHTLNNYSQKERAFLNSVGDGLVAIDRDWTITLWNKAASAISGFSQEEVIGKNLRSVLRFVRERDRSENVAFIEEAMVFGRVGILENNTVLIRKDGTEIPAGDSAAPIFDDSGKVTGAIIVFRDISKEREMQLIRSDFAYASHQLRTPVTKALWSLEAVLEEKSQKANENLINAYLSIQSINKLTEHLLTISDIEGGKVIPKFTKVSLREVVDAVLGAFSQKAKERNSEISLSLSPEVESLKTDANLLKKALHEILDNALEYSSRGEKIEINVLPQEKDLLIEIKDYGIGIPQSQQPLIFTRFFRGSNIDTTKSIGAGLGLFIAREYVKLLKGKIWFKSIENVGTTFSILLPHQ